jgi:hypothetical protein
MDESYVSQKPYAVDDALWRVVRIAVEKDMLEQFIGST